MLTKAELKNLKSLNTKKGRRSANCFVAEGVRLLEGAVGSQFMPKTVYFAPSVVTERAQRLLDRFRDSNIPCREISSRQADQISSVRSSQGIVAEFDLPHVVTDFEGLKTELRTKNCRKILLCDDINDPGNLDTLIRSALAFGFAPVILTGECAEPYSPKVIRASAGAIFGVKIIRVDRTSVLKLASTLDLQILAADKDGSDHLTENKSSVDKSQIILAIGSEASGLSDGMLEAATHRLRIPHDDRVESLNAGVAGSILMSRMYES